MSHIFNVPLLVGILVSVFAAGIAALWYGESGISDGGE